MATYNGTNGSDNLVGTAADDVFNPLLGADSVDGGDGVDTLNIDYSTQNIAHYSSFGGGGGYVAGGNSYVSFQRIENLIAKLSRGADAFQYTASTGLSVNINAGTGTDTLIADFRELTGNTNFTVGANGAIASNRGTFVSFEAFTIQGGAGNDTITTGALNDTIYGYGGTNTLNGGGGNDYIYSEGGIDTINGGADTDYWTANYGDTAIALTANFNGTSATISDGTSATNIESIQFTGSAANDTFTVVGVDSGRFVGGDGDDSLSMDRSGAANAATFYAYSDGDGCFAGYFSGFGYADFSGFEAISLTGTGQDDTFQIYTDPLRSGATLAANGGAGTDRLFIDFGTLTDDTSFVVGAGAAITSNRGTFGGFEVFQIFGGAGDDTITTGIGNDEINGAGGANTLSGGGGDDYIYSTGGIDTVNGGAGNDYWRVNYADTAIGLTASFSGTSATLSDGSSAIGIETFDFTGSAGNDSIIVTGLVSATLNAGLAYSDAGNDSLTVDLSRVVTGTTFQAYGNGGSESSGYASGNFFLGFDTVSLTGTRGDDVFSLQTDALRFGGTLAADGWVGADQLQIDFGTLTGSTSFVVGSGGAIASNRGTFANFESFSVNGGAGDDTITTGALADTIYGNGGINALNGGAGDDTILSVGGIDTVNGGAGTLDIWEANYTATSLGLTATFGATSASVSDGSSATNVERFRFYGGTGDDIVIDNGTVSGDLRGGSGSNALTMNYTAVNSATLFYAYSGSQGRFTGYSSHTASTSFSDFGTLSLIGTARNDTFQISADPLRFGATLAADGGAGNDSIDINFSGLLGNTSFVVGAGGAIISNRGTFANFETFTIIGAAGADTFRGGAGADYLDGGAGNDVIEGGAGNDTLIGGNGIDTLSYATATSRVGVRLAVTSAQNTVGAGSDTISGFENLIGSAFDDTLTGTTGANVIEGGAGNDTIDGAAGIDTASYAGAGAGVVVSLAITGVQDTIGAGSDSLVGIENLTGSAFDDTLSGNAGDNVLNGGDGFDTLFFATATGAVTFDLAVTTAQANAGTGNDTVAGFEALTGTSLGDTLSGDGAANTLDGGSGDDVLVGRGGTDTLIGGAGADTMTGGTGGDTYHVDDVADVVVELAGEGLDTVRTTLNAYTLGDHVETLRFTGSGAFAGTGNALDNLIAGGAGGDMLDGGLGADAMTGGDGGDTYVVDDAGDQVTEQESDTGTDRIVTTLAALTLATGVEDLLYAGTADFSGTGNALNNGIVGGAGDDTLDGGLGADMMVGGSGSDGYVVDDAGDQVIEQESDPGTDRITTTLAALTLTTGVEELVYAGNAAFTGTGNALNNVITGGAGDDTLDGGVGADTMTGGSGSDDYAVDDAGDQVIELAGDSGTDRITTTLAALTLAGGVEELAYAGTGTFTGTGNALDNVLIGGAGGDTLDGGTGADTMTGGDGGDRYSVDDAGDQVIELAGDSGTDRVTTTLASLMLADGVEELVYAGTAGFAGTGNALDNVIVGGAGDDMLDGGSGADAMTGGAGSDHYVVDDAGDQVIEVADDPGIDRITTTLASLTLAGGVEELVFTGTTAFAGTGNALDNLLVGGAANDTLAGGAGDDRLDGGAGADAMTGGAGDDVYVVDSTGDRVVELAGGGYDTVVSALQFRMGSEIEALMLSGDAAVGGTGNALDNAMTGNGAGNVLNGGAGNDVLTGLGGNDTLDGGSGTDTMTGGTGDDLYFVRDAGDVIVENADQGIDTVRAGVNYTLADHVENIVLQAGARIGTGNALANRMTGTGGGDTLSGLDGADLLFGDAGNDVLLGGAGNDVIVGGAGKDVMTGGAGLDLFRFAGGDFGNTNFQADVITDFSRTDGDRINLSQVDANVGVAGDQAFAFIGTAAFGGVAGQLRYTVAGGNTFVQGDTNGDGVSDFIIRIDGTLPLIATDFAL